MLPVRGARLHVVQRLADVAEREILQLQRGRLVRIDGDECHAAIAIVVGELAEARFVELRCRTGIAGEDDRQHPAAGVFTERVHLAVDAGQREVGRRGPARQPRPVATATGGHDRRAATTRGTIPELAESASERRKINIFPAISCQRSAIRSQQERADRRLLTADGCIYFASDVPAGASRARGARRTPGALSRAAPSALRSSRRG